MVSQELIDHIQNRERWRLHEGTCELVLGTKVPTSETGETCDVYILPHCNCWVSEGIETITPKRASRILETISEWSGKVEHDRGCDKLYPEPIIYRGRRELLRKNCNCWVTDWKG